MTNGTYKEKKYQKYGWTSQLFFYILIPFFNKFLAGILKKTACDCSYLVAFLGCICSADSFMDLISTWHNWYETPQIFGGLWHNKVYTANVWH